MNQTRRNILSALGAALPFGVGSRVAASPAPAPTGPTLIFRPFEDAVRDAFAIRRQDGSSACWRIEVGSTDLIRAGVQGCCNDRPFAGFAAGRLRIVRSGAEPGPARDGVRLFVATVDVVLAESAESDAPARPLDFSTIPPAPAFA